MFHTIDFDVYFTLIFTTYSISKSLNLKRQNRNFTKFTSTNLKLISVQLKLLKISIQFGVKGFKNVEVTESGGNH